MANHDQPHVRRPARLSLFLAQISDPPTAANLLAMDKFTKNNQARIAELELIRLTAPPSKHPSIDAILAELAFVRKYLWWRSFRINDLPVEILTNILRFAVWSTGDPAEGVMHRLHLTWVSHYWRRLVIGDHTLWNAAWVQDRAPYVRTQAWIDRAGRAPLDIRFDDSEHTSKGYPVLDEGAAARLLHIVLPKLTQVRMLVFILKSCPPARTILRVLQGAQEVGVPVNIERFELHCEGKPFVPEHTTLDAQDAHATPILFAGHGSLKHLALNGVHVDWVRSPIRNLTTIDLRRMPLAASPSLVQFREMLSACPNLQQLALDGAGPMVDEHTQRLPPIHLPHVRTFTLGDFSVPYALYVLAQISMPNTRDLTLMNLTGEDYAPVLATLTGTMPEVRLLTMYTIDIAHTKSSRRTLMSWLRSMPLVRYLRIAQLESHVFDALLDDPCEVPKSSYPDGADDDGSSSDSDSSESSSSTREVLCPHLSCLEFQHINVNAVVAFGEGRKALQMPLRKIYINRPWVPRLLKADVGRLKLLAELVSIPDAYPTPEERLAVQD
ncbi:hypothetical protein FIBSPDRAFT_852060 [Athelia psychrophila]|uniref:F-box domain-containing protein n=1 Tax=Athelia psychrophila TaxID=1759441 RepID=A0A166RYL8_9AGAM|nr:hypothetical protein FIBSPDRAFT_852060 [Fibularhizoctonia sp. CBS 109695]